MKTELDGLDIFIAVAELNSFSQAANKLKVSKAHVSRQITALEQRLNIGLFVRSTRHVKLTEAGLRLYGDIHEHIAQLYRAQNSLLDRYHLPSGMLKISVAGGFGEEVVAPVAIKFMQQYPNVEVNMHFSDAHIDLFKGEADLAIRSGVLQDSSLIARKITSRNLITCASPEFFKQHGIPQTPEELPRFNCLKGSSDYWHFERNNTPIQVKIMGNWKSNNARALMLAAIQGLGLVQLPDFYLNESLQKLQLETCLEGFQSRSNAVWAVYHQSQKLSIKVQKFVKLLSDEVVPQGQSPIKFRK